MAEYLAEIDRAGEPAIDVCLLSLNASPGGSARMLLPDSIAKQKQALSVPAGNYGDAELWKG
jgi:hypothetical protein